MTLSTLLSRTEKIVIDNSPAILTAIGVVGTVTTAFLSGKAAIKAHDILENDYERRLNNANRIPSELEPSSGRKRFELTWKVFVPPVGSGLLTVAAIVGANHIGTRRAAGIASAFALSEKAYVEYKEKVLEKLGPDKEKTLRDELAQERVSRTPGSREVLVVGTDVLCLDAYTGRYFTSNTADLRSAENEVNALVINNSYASLTDLYDRLGIPKTIASDEVGWNIQKMLKLELSAALADDGRPCISVGYEVDSNRDYWRNN